MIRTFSRVPLLALTLLALPGCGASLNSEEVNPFVRFLGQLAEGSASPTPMATPAAVPTVTAAPTAAPTIASAKPVAPAVVDPLLPAAPVATSKPPAPLPVTPY